jgi:hypothetical protein
MIDPLIQQAWFVVGGVVLVGVIWLAKWITREIASDVVDAIGDTLSQRWKEDMSHALGPIYAELQDNGGASLKDKIRSIDNRLDDIESQLEGQIVFHPDRRFYDEGDAGHI